VRASALSLARTDRPRSGRPVRAAEGARRPRPHETGVHLATPSPIPPSPHPPIPPLARFAAFLEDEKLPLVEEGLLQLQSLAAAHLAAPAPAAAAAPPPPQPQQPPQGLPQPGAAAAAAARPQGPPQPQPPPPAVDRRLQVILPVASEIDLDESFFERTPADVKAEYARLLARRRAGEVLATRAHREAARAAAAGPAPREAVVRVRFPEVRRRKNGAPAFLSACTPSADPSRLPPYCGLHVPGPCAPRGPSDRRASHAPLSPPPSPPRRNPRRALPQGVQLSAAFGASEPLSRVHEAVAAALRDPAALFELVLPDRRPLPRDGRVADAGIAPAVLLNFRPLGAAGPPGGGGGGGGRGRGPPTLSDEMLRLARVD
jgi:hypothetical protein